MKILSDNVCNLCFDDHVVELMMVNFKENTILIRTDGAYLIENGKIQQLSSGVINIFDFRYIMISMYLNEDKKWIDLDENDYDILKEINEIEFNDNLILRGFGKKTGQWIQYKIANPTVDINFSS